MAPTLGDRVTRLEALFENLGKQISRELEIAHDIHDKTEKSLAALTIIVSGHEKRFNAIDHNFARLFAGIAVVVAVISLLAPLVLRSLGLGM